MRVVQVTSCARSFQVTRHITPCPPPKPCFPPSAARACASRCHSQKSSYRRCRCRFVPSFGFHVFVLIRCFRICHAASGHVRNCHVYVTMTAMMVVALIPFPAGPHYSAEVLLYICAPPPPLFLALVPAPPCQPISIPPPPPFPIAAFAVSTSFSRTSRNPPTPASH